MPRDHTTPRCHGEFKHFKTAVLTDGIFLAGFDYFGKSVNVLNVESMSEWQEIVQFAEQSAAIKGVVFDEHEGREFLCRSRSGADARRATATFLSGDGTARDDRPSGSLTRWGGRRNRLSPRWKAPAWVVDSSWRWPAICASPVPIPDVFRSSGSQAGYSSWVRRHSTSSTADRLTGGIGHDHDGEDGLCPAGSADGACGWHGYLYRFRMYGPWKIFRKKPLFKPPLRKPTSSVQLLSDDAPSGPFRDS